MTVMSGRGQLGVILHAVECFSTCDDFAEVGRTILEQLAACVGTAGGSMYVRGKDALRLVFTFEPDHVPDSIPLPLPAGSAFQSCIEQREAILLDGGSWNTDCAGSGWKGYSDSHALLLPLFDHSQSITGVVSLHDKAVPPFTDEDVSLCRLLIAIGSETMRGIQSNEAVRESERRLSTLLRNLPGMAFRCLDAGQWTMEFVSEGSLALTGYSPEAFMQGGSANYGDLIHPDDRSRVQQAAEQALRVEVPFEVTYRIRTKAGEERWVWQKGVGVRFAAGRDPQIEGFVSDITSQLASQRQLARVGTALDQASEAIFITNTEGVVEYTNQSFEQLTGFKDEEILGEGRNLFPIGLNPESPDCQRLRRSEAAGMAWKGEVQCRRKDGSILEALVRLAPLRDGKGNLQNLVYVVSDVSTEHKLKAQLLQAQKMEAIGSLASGIAHEINTPTQYIGDNLRFLEESFGDMAQLLQHCASAAEEVSPLDVQEIAKAAQSIGLQDLLDEIPGAIRESLDGNGRVAEIVRAMKAFAHPDDEHFHGADINAALESAASVARNEWKYVADLALELDEGLPEVACQIGALNQVFLNLIVNAAHATEERRQRDQVEEKGRIVLCTRREGEDWVAISVADEGVGIPKEIRSRVFDPFFTTKGVGKGTGQGLSLAHSVVVDQHNGRIELESEEGHGATFTVFLPLGEENGPSR